jgi:triosephosphate isomerase
MPGTIRPLIAGNWKMNGLQGSVAELDAVLNSGAAAKGNADLLICPPATLVAAFAARAKASQLAIGGQDCHTEASGAHTGDISAAMLADAGATAVIVGHSERRTDHHETDGLVRSKAEAAWRAGLIAIVCVGETQTERDAGRAMDAVGGQLAGSIPDGATAANLVVAYEPVWAIGTGLTPTSEDIEQIHMFIRKNLTDRFKAEGAGMRLLYGGSLKPGNAPEILSLANVNGGLIGGASLKAADFLAIATAVPT